MPRKVTPPAAPPEASDPLADLRDDDDAPGLETPTPEPEAAPEPELGGLRPMVDAATLDEMVTEAVVAFHQDPTSQGFLHGGGQCGCRYIARKALEAAVPVMTEADLEERELEESGAPDA